MYLAITTRPDIFHCVTKLAQLNAYQHKEHEAAAKRVLRYLRGTVDLKLHYERTGVPIHCFVDADWAGDSTDRKSFTGWVLIATGAVFTWASKKQPMVAQSRTEAECAALSTAARGAAYVRKLINEMGFGSLQVVQTYGDNQSAQCLVKKNDTFHLRSKHIDIIIMLENCIRKKIIEINYVPTENMISYVLTKNLNRVKNEKCVKMMELH